MGWRGGLFGMSIPTQWNAWADKLLGTAGRGVAQGRKGLLLSQLFPLHLA